jgi:hypothetical protein
MFLHYEPLNSREKAIVAIMVAVVVIVGVVVALGRSGILHMEDSNKKNKEIGVAYHEGNRYQVICDSGVKYGMVVADTGIFISLYGEIEEVEVYAGKKDSSAGR